MKTLYTSDTHLGHANIIKYTRRPFKDVDEMDAALVANLRAAEANCDRLIHCGDLSLDFGAWRKSHPPIFGDAVVAENWIVLGNHDRAKGKDFEYYGVEFERIVGTRNRWKDNSFLVADLLRGRPVIVLVSHKPQPLEDSPADVNVYGHVHNKMLLPDENYHPEDDWSFASPTHFCACVELHGFKPVTLDELAAAQRNGYRGGLEWIAPER